MAEIRWALLAQADVARIYRYHRGMDIGVAVELTERILAASKILSDLPQAGPATARGDRRKWKVPKTDYILFYRIEREHVRILRVPHGAQHQAARQ